MTPSDDGPDLVLAGAGGGLVAALRAAELGCSVLVVEASEHFRRGNNTAMSTAMVPGAGTRWQEAAGVYDSPAVFVDDIMRKTNGQADRALTKALATVSGRLVTWLADDVGLPISLVTDFPYPGHSRLRCHTVPGRSGRRLLAGLSAAVADSTSITLLTRARLTAVESGNGPVTGAVLTYPDGSTESVPTRAVLLATSGFAADPELVREHIPEIAGAVYHGSSESTGDALRIGASVGADTAFLDAYQGHAALALPAGTLVGWATVMHGAFLVNDNGERFGNETVGYSEYARECFRQPQQHAVLILDKRIHDSCLAFDDFRDTVESGALRWADDVATLGASVDIPGDRLTATVESCRAIATGDRDDTFGRKVWEAPLEPPYAAVRVTPALFHTQGGLRVDEHARVLRPDGSAISGLYASGGAAMSISGHGPAGYLAGNGLLPALGLALLAAEDVAGAAARHD